MHEQAYNCHTYDRENMVAQLDCNNERAAVETAANELFKIKHWPYMHHGAGDGTVTSCIKQISAHYLPNIINVLAIRNMVSLVVTVASVITIQSL